MRENMFKKQTVWRNLLFAVLMLVFGIYMQKGFFQTFAYATEDELLKTSGQISAPWNLKTVNPKNDTMVLKWSTVSGAEKYYVYYSTSENGAYEFIGTTTDHQVIISNMEDDKVYYFKVKAYANGQGSEFSAPVSGKKNIKGVDVSYHNGIIDWDAVKNSGLVDFAIIRCGYGSNLTNQDDIKFVYNMQECQRVGIPLGAYIYSYAQTVAQAQSEADHTLRMIAGHEFPYKIWYDLEDDNTTMRQNAKTIGDMAQVYCNAIEQAGFEVGIYASKYWFTSILTDSRFSRWPKWVAQYNSTCTYDGLYIMWQYSDSGSIPGINTKVDVNYAYTDRGMDLSNVESMQIGGAQFSLDAPIGLSYNLTSDNHLQINWNTVMNASGYDIYRASSSNGSYAKVGEAGMGSWIDLSTKPGEVWYYKIRATCIGKQSPYSVVLKASVELGSVTGIKTGTKDYHSIEIKWSAVPYANSYTIYKYEAVGGTYKTISNVTGTSYVDTNCVTGKTYFYRIRAVSKGSDGSVLKGKTSGYNSAKAKLTTPVISSVTSAGYSTLKITFSKVEGATEYQIYRSYASNGAYKLIKTTTSTTYYDSNLYTGVNYTYYVVAVRDADGVVGKSNRSAAVKGKAELGKVYGVSVTSQTAGTVKLSWISVTGATGYAIYRCGPDGSYERVAKIGKATTYTLTGQTRGQTYSYKVAAYRVADGHGSYGEDSSPVSVTVK